MYKKERVSNCHLVYIGINKVSCTKVVATGQNETGFYIKAHLTRSNWINFVNLFLR